MITSYRVDNFKSIASSVEQSEHLRFEPMTILIGPNGVGKSALLQSIDFLRAFFEGNVDEFLRAHGWEYADLPNLRKTQKKIEWRVNFQVPPNENGKFGGHYFLNISVLKRRYINVGRDVIKYTPNDSENKAPTTVDLVRREGRATSLQSPETEANQHAYFFDLPSSVASYIDRSLHERELYPEIVHFLNYIRGIKFATIFDVENLREPRRGYADEIGPKGENLLPFLAKLQSTDEKRFLRIKRRTLSLFETISDFNVRGHASPAATKILDVYEGRTLFNGRQVSDGFLRILSIVCLLESPTPPSILLFEEPENGVHPRLLSHMVDIFKLMTQRKRPHSTQVFLTTHSPYVLDMFRDQPESVYTVRRKGTRSSSEFRRLDHLFPRGIPEPPLGETWYADELFGA